MSEYEYIMAVRAVSRLYGAGGALEASNEPLSSMLYEIANTLFAIIERCKGEEAGK